MRVNRLCLLEEYVLLVGRLLPAGDELHCRLAERWLQNVTLRTAKVASSVLKFIGPISSDIPYSVTIARAIRVACWSRCEHLS